MGEEAETLLKGRVRIINVWRPIGHPVAHKPLAVSDWRSLDTEHDLVPVRFIYPDRVGGKLCSPIEDDDKLTLANRNFQREVQPQPSLVLPLQPNPR